MRWSVAATACLALLCRLASAQTNSNQVSFEAASVKPVAADADDNMRGGPGTPDPGRVSYSGVTLNMVIRIAYDVKRYQIDGPAWMDTDKFDHRDLSHSLHLAAVPGYVAGSPCGTVSNDPTPGYQEF